MSECQNLALNLSQEVLLEKQREARKRQEKVGKLFEKATKILRKAGYDGKTARELVLFITNLIVHLGISRSSFEKAHFKLSDQGATRMGKKIIFQILDLIEEGKKNGKLLEKLEVEIDELKAVIEKLGQM
ncbi:MAG: hypothetical protein PHC97_01485 [Patescibacteria group bacterium]|nr:hypothetical protein [Patescibacteria group bacterium]